MSEVEKNIPFGIRHRYEVRIGERVGKLKLVLVAGRDKKSKRVMGVFVCDCGNKISFPISRVLNDAAKTHCGCDTDYTSNIIHSKHGSRTYRSWQAMKQRCLNTGCKDYQRYGGAGIKIHEPWINSFAEFYRHIGDRPIGTTLDRIDNTKGYFPGNVRWAPASTQQRNRSGSYVWHIKGKTFETAKDAAQFHNVSIHTIWRWVNGALDVRRGSGVSPVEGCYVESRY